MKRNFSIRIKNCFFTLSFLVIGVSSSLTAQTIQTISYTSNVQLYTAPSSLETTLQTMKEGLLIGELVEQNAILTQTWLVNVVKQ